MFNAASTADGQVSKCGECEVGAQLRNHISDLLEENANLKRLDETLRHNTALFEALIANSSDGIALTGPDRRIIKIVRGLTGIEPAHLAGTLIESLAVPEDRETIIECYSRLLRRECPQVRRTIHVMRADGVVRRFAITLTDMLDHQSVQAIVWNYQDVTDHQPRMS